MIFIKILVTILVVTFLSVVAERGGPRLAGILAGYPAGSAISLFFIGLEQGADFAAQSAMYNVAGMVALQCFLLIYYLITVRFLSEQRFAAILSGGVSATAGFLAISALLHQINLSPWGGVGLTALSILTFTILFRGIHNTGIRKRVELGPKVLIFRACISAVVIVLVTGVAGLVGAQWAGLFSAFPATVFPLLIIVHHTYGPRQAHTVIKNVPVGLWSLVLYSISISYTYPKLGLAWGTLSSFGIATVYLLALAGIQLFRNRMLARHAQTKLV